MQDFDMMDLTFPLPRVMPILIKDTPKRRSAMSSRRFEKPR